MATRRKPQLKAGKTGGFENVDAESMFELDPNGTEERPASHRWLRLTGKFAPPTWQEFAQAAMMEIMGTAILGVLVVLARWYDLGSLIIAIAYYVGIWSMSHMNGSHSLRRHLNGPLTLAYFLTGQIGLLGVAFYKSCQLIGSLIGGAVLSRLIGGVYVGKLPVPFPTTLNSSLTTAVCLEIFVTAVIILVTLITEFINTKEAENEKNYRKSMKTNAFITAVLVLVLFQFQAWTFNDNVYLTGLFAGFDQSSPLLRIPEMSQQSDPGYINRVFVDGSAWALYYFGPWAGGLAAVLVFWLFFTLFARDPKDPMPKAFPAYQKAVQFGSEVSASVAAPIETHLDQLINPLLKK